MSHSIFQKTMVVAVVVAVIVLPLAIAQSVREPAQAVLGTIVDVRPSSKITVPPGELKGQLLRPDGSSAGAQNVIVSNRESGAIVTKAQSDAAGHFKMNLEVGKYYLSSTSLDQPAVDGRVELEVVKDEPVAYIRLFVQQTTEGYSTSTKVIGAVAVTAVIAGVTLGTIAIADENSEDLNVFGDGKKTPQSKPEFPAVVGVADTDQPQRSVAESGRPGSGALGVRFGDRCRVITIA